jgi:hypothetical protein
MAEMPQHGRHQHRKYVMTCSDFDDLWTRAAGRCEICGVLWRFTPHGMLHIDHNHLLGDWAVRGLLCSRCNTQLGTANRLLGVEVDAYLANPWRTAMPERLAMTITSQAALGDFAEVCAEYRAAVTEHDAAGARLRQGVLDRARVLPHSQITRATGLSRERVRQIIATDERRRQRTGN